MHNISFLKKEILRKLKVSHGKKLGLGFFLIQILISRNEALVKLTYNYFSA